MLDASTLLTYALIVTGFAILPGPSVLLTVARSASAGTRVGISISLGIAVGDLVHTALAVLGVSAILMASAIAFSIMKYLGAAYLIYLGLKAIFEPSSRIDLPSSELITPKDAFRQGFICEALNPKSAMFFLAFLPQFVHPTAGNVSVQLAVLGLLFVMIGTVVTIIYASAAGRVGTFLRRNSVVTRWQNKVVGSLYCTLGVLLGTQER